MQTQQLGASWGQLRPSRFGLGEEGCRLFTAAIVTAWKAYKAVPATMRYKQIFVAPGELVHYIKQSFDGSFKSNMRLSTEKDDSLHFAQNKMHDKIR